MEILLTDFYEIAITDPVIGHHFEDIDLESHMPVILNFWEKILLGKPVYYGNPLAVHKKLNDKSDLHLNIFSAGLRFLAKRSMNVPGEIADAAKLRAKMVAHSLNQRISEIPNHGGNVSIAK